MFLIDTDIIIYSLKNNESVIRNFKLFFNEPKAVSIITIGELLYGATALSMNYSIITNNEKHFKKIPGLDVINWAKE